MSSEAKTNPNTNNTTKILIQRNILSAKSTNSAIKILEINKNMNKKLNIETIKTGETTPLITVNDSNILKTYSTSNNLSKSNNKLFKADIILSNTRYKRKISKKEKRNRQILRVYSDVIDHYKKIKSQISHNYDNKDKKEENKNEENIKKLIKKKRTDIKLLIKELDLNYDTDNLDLEKIMWKKRKKFNERFKNKEQIRLLNQVEQQIKNEDIILSKKIILENNLEKKLKSRKKKLNEKKFEEMTIKRKELKHHIIGFKLKYESDYINKLMKFQAHNFNDQNSLQALLHKYKVMKYN